MDLTGPDGNEFAYTVYKTELITPDDVVRRIELYYEGGSLDYATSSAAGEELSP